MKEHKITFFLTVKKSGIYLERLLDNIEQQSLEEKCVVILMNPEYSKHCKLKKRPFERYIEYILTEDEQFEAVQRILDKDETEYYCILEEDDHLLDQKFIADAISFLDENSHFTSYSANTEMLYDDGLMKKEIELSEYLPHSTAYTSYGIEEYICYQKQYALTPYLAVFKNIRVDKKEIQKLQTADADMPFKCMSAPLTRFLLSLKYGAGMYSDVIGLRHSMCGKSNSMRLLESAQILLMLEQICDIRHCKKFYALAEKRILEVLKTSMDLNVEVKNAGMILAQKARGIDLSRQFEIYELGDANPDKIFLVIGSSLRNWGLFTTCVYFLGAVEFAINNHLVPLIDWKNYYMPMMQDMNKKYIENAWNYYFEDIVPEYKLNEVMQSKNVIFCDEFEWCNIYAEQTLQVPLNPQQFEHLHGLVTKYLILKPEIIRDIDVLYQNIFPKDERVLGVNVRASYIRSAKIRHPDIKNHPKQYELEELIKVINQKMKLWNCSYVYISSDCADYLEGLTESFGERCLYMERKRRVCFKNGKPVLEENEMKEEINRISTRQHTTEYLKEVHLLARCTCLLGSKASSGIMAYLLNGGEYENCEFYDAGEY